MSATILKHPAHIVRFIELRQVGPGDRWQGIYCGDEWCEAFHTTVSQRWLVLDRLRTLDDCRGLPVIVRDGCFMEKAA